MVKKFTRSSENVTEGDLRRALDELADRVEGKKKAVEAENEPIGVRIVSASMHAVENAIYKNLRSNFEAYFQGPMTRKEPPALAESMLLLLSKRKYRDSLCITLSEEFERRLETGCSLRRARRLYWISVAQSLGPQAQAFARRHGAKALKWLGSASLVEEVVRRLTH